MAKKLFRPVTITIDGEDAVKLLSLLHFADCVTSKEDTLADIGKLLRHIDAESGTQPTCFQRVWEALDNAGVDAV